MNFTTHDTHNAPSKDSLVPSNVRLNFTVELTIQERKTLEKRMGQVELPINRAGLKHFIYTYGILGITSTDDEWHIIWNVIQCGGNNNGDE